MKGGEASFFASLTSAEGRKVNSPNPSFNPNSNPNPNTNPDSKPNSQMALTVTLSPQEKWDALREFGYNGYMGKRIESKVSDFAPSTFSKTAEDLFVKFNDANVAGNVDVLARYATPDLCTALKKQIKKKKRKAYKVIDFTKRAEVVQMRCFTSKCKKPRPSSLPHLHLRQPYEPIVPCSPHPPPPPSC
jgi:hypothetical protein